MCFMYHLFFLLALSSFLHHSFMSSSTDHSNVSHAMPYRTASLQYSHLTHTPSPFYLLFTRPRTLSSRCPLLLAFLFLSGDIELNPGPVSFTLCTLNIRSILHPLHSAALSDLIDTHNPDLFCLTETWIKPTTTSAELSNCTPPNYTLLSVPRNHSGNSTCIGGGTGFLIREPFTQLPTSLPDFSSFESSSITLQLPRSKISVYNIYRPPSSSPLSKPNSVFLEDFQSFLSLATTPHEFIITGDFNIHLDNPADHLTSQFLSLLSSFNLTQHVNFPTHNKHHILDLVITSSDCSLAPSLSSSHCSPSDHFPVFTTLSINPSPLPPPTLHLYSFRRFHRIGISSFLSDLKSSRHITHPPKSLGSLLIAYNTTLSTHYWVCSTCQQPSIVLIISCCYRDSRNIAACRVAFYGG